MTQQQHGQIPTMLQKMQQLQQNFDALQQAVQINEHILHHLCSDLAPWGTWSIVDAQIKRIDQLKQDAWAARIRLNDFLSLQDQKLKPRINSSLGGWV